MVDDGHTETLKLRAPCIVLEEPFSECMLQGTNKVETFARR